MTHALDPPTAPFEPVAPAWAPLTPRQIVELIADKALGLGVTTTRQLVTVETSVDDDGCLIVEVTRWRPRAEEDDTVRMLLRPCEPTVVAPRPAPAGDPDLVSDAEGSAT